MVQTLSAPVSLDHLLNQQTTLSPLEALRITRECAKALRAYHQQHSSSLGLCPGSVRLHSQGHVELVSVSQVPREYLPPEDAGGQSSQHRSDLYGLGMVLYRCVAGRTLLPFNHTGAAKPDQIFDALLRMQKEFPELSFGMIHLLQRALAAQPWQRYPSADEFLADIESVSLSLSPKKTAEDTASPPKTRKRIPADTLALLAGGALSLLLLSFWGLTPKHGKTKHQAATTTIPAAATTTAMTVDPSPPTNSIASPPGPESTAIPPDTSAAGTVQDASQQPETEKPEELEIPFTTKPSRPWPSSAGLIAAFFSDLSEPLDDVEHLKILAQHWCGAIDVPANLTHSLRQINKRFVSVQKELAFGVWKDPIVLQGDNRISVYSLVEQYPDLFLPLELSTRRNPWRLANLDARWSKLWPELVYPRVQQNEADAILLEHCHPLPTSAGLLDAPANQPGWWRKHVPQFLQTASKRLGPGCPLVVNLPTTFEVKDVPLYADAAGFRFSDSLAATMDPNDWLGFVSHALMFTSRNQVVILDVPVTSDTLPSERIFLFGTYLLLQSDRTYVCMSMANPRERLWLPELDLELGDPLSKPPAKLERLWHSTWQVYARQFQEGLVLVNPGEAQVIALPGPMDRITLEGVGQLLPSGGSTPRAIKRELVRKMTLEGNAAAILLKPKELPPESPEGPAGTPDESIDLMPE